MGVGSTLKAAALEERRGWNRTEQEICGPCPFDPGQLHLCRRCD
ncbi:MAG: hypothetical protein ACYDDI_04160 [Candidatus Acidiferrales bacterium]